jgi:hypothetical protein
VKNVKTAEKIKVEIKTSTMMRPMLLADWLLWVSHQRSQIGMTKSINIVPVIMIDATISILSLLQSLILVVLVSAFA